MQDESYTKVTGKPYPDYGIPLCPRELCPNHKKPMTFFGKFPDDRYQDHWICTECGAASAINPNPHVVAHEDKIADITQDDWKLLIAALEMAVTCKEVEVDVAQAEADAKADALRDLIVLKRKLEAS